MSYRGIVATLLCAVLLSGCVIGANWSPRVLGHRHNTIIMSDGLRVTHGALAPEWRRTAKTAQSLQFDHEASSATLSAAVYCGKFFEDLPLVSLMGQLFTGMPAQTVLSEESLRVAARGALRQHSIRQLDGVRVFADAVVFKRDQCQVDVYTVAPESARAVASAAVTDFVRSIDFVGRE